MAKRKKTVEPVVEEVKMPTQAKVVTPNDGEACVECGQPMVTTNTIPPVSFCTNKNCKVAYKVA